MRNATDDTRRLPSRSLTCAVAVTGPAGVGKTAFCLELARRAIKPWKPVFLSSARFANTGEIWQAVLCALERDFTGLTSYEARLHIVDAARRRAGGGGGLLLIVDEAHLLESHLLEELRVLTAELEGGRPIIRLVLSGQLELEERLALPELTALSQRLASHVLLEPLTRGESRQFVRQQVEAAGGRLEDIFAEDALDLICAAGDGNCRCLNLLCDHTLLLAYVAEERPASAATVQSALDDDLFTPTGMRDSDARMAATYERAGARANYRGELYPGPHRFDLAMQAAAFAWLRRHLAGG